MTSAQPGQARYALVKTDRRNWEIHDLTLRAPASQPVAELLMSEDDRVEVVWITPIPLPIQYATAQDVLADLILWERRGRGSTKPIPIPHRPPPHG